jgi:hypothetical protein
MANRRDAGLELLTTRWGRMSEVTFLFVGVLAGYGLCRWLIGSRQSFAARLGLSPKAPTGYLPPPGASAPAVDPGRLPDTLTPEDVRNGAAETLPDPELKRLVETLMAWAPLQHRSERKFHHSFEDFLFEHGYTDADIEYEPRVFWTAVEGVEERHAKPDFVIRKRVLVEIKRNITGSGDSDRSLGQMLRYLIAWAGKGPAILIVCNQYDDNLRALVQRHVRSWKAQGVPVMAYFVRSRASSEAIADLPSES